MEEILVSAQEFHAGLITLRNVDVWKSANHLDDHRPQKRILNA
jgi:hypothetical protein